MVGVFMRYLPAAVATQHLTMSMGLAYYAVIAQIAEEGRVADGHCYLAFVYDDIFRKSLSQRCRSGEAVDLMADFFSGQYSV